MSDAVVVTFAADRTAIDQYLAELRSQGVVVPVKFAGGEGGLRAPASPVSTLSSPSGASPAPYQSPSQVAGQSLNGGRFSSNQTNSIVAPQLERPDSAPSLSAKTALAQNAASQVVPIAVEPTIVQPESISPQSLQNTASDVKDALGGFAGGMRQGLARSMWDRLSANKKILFSERKGTLESKVQGDFDSGNIKSEEDVMRALEKHEPSKPRSPAQVAGQNSTIAQAKSVENLLSAARATDLGESAQAGPQTSGSKTLSNASAGGISNPTPPTTGGSSTQTDISQLSSAAKMLAEAAQQFAQGIKGSQGLASEGQTAGVSSATRASEGPQNAINNLVRKAALVGLSPQEKLEALQGSLSQETPGTLPHAKLQYEVAQAEESVRRKEAAEQRRSSAPARPPSPPARPREEIEQERNAARYQRNKDAVDFAQFKQQDREEKKAAEEEEGPEDKPSPRSRVPEDRQPRRGLREGRQFSRLATYGFLAYEGLNVANAAVDQNIESTLAARSGDTQRQLQAANALPQLIESIPLVGQAASLFTSAQRRDAAIATQNATEGQKDVEAQAQRAADVYRSGARVAASGRDAAALSLSGSYVRDRDNIRNASRARADARNAEIDSRKAAIAALPDGPDRNRLVYELNEYAVTSRNEITAADKLSGAQVIESQRVEKLDVNRIGRQAPALRAAAEGQLGVAANRKFVEDRQNAQADADEKFGIGSAGSRVQRSINLLAAGAEIETVRERTREAGAQADITESLLNRQPLQASLRGITENYRQNARNARTQEEEDGLRRGARASVNLSTQQYNDQISEDRLGLRASTQSLDIRNRTDKDQGSLDAVAQETDIYNRGRLRALALHNAGRDTLIPDVVANTQSQLDAFQKETFNRFKVTSARFSQVDFSKYNSSDLGEAIDKANADRAKLGKNPLDFDDLGGAQQGDPAASAANAKSLSDIDDNTKPIADLKGVMNQILQNLTF